MDKTDILNKLASYPARWFLSFHKNPEILFDFRLENFVQERS